jgi:NAD(P)-dependent dehydrogenase (short-subunit alcohol dehydrogenase family)
MNEPMFLSRTDFLRTGQTFAYSFSFRSRRKIMQVDKHLEGKVALITGAGSGIGKATALLMAKAGAKIGALANEPGEIIGVVADIKRSGGEAIPIVADVSRDDQMHKAVFEPIDKWGRLDIVFANAGINGVWAPIEELKAEDWDTTLQTNLKGTFLTVKYATPHLKVHGGSITITSSVNGTREFSNTGATAYATSKAGQVAFAKMVALELAQFGIRVNVICPGAISTSIEESTHKSPNLDEVKIPAEFPEGDIPLTHGKPGSAEDVAQLVLFLASDAACHISGTEVWIDGAGSLLRG